MADSQQRFRTARSAATNFGPNAVSLLGLSQTLQLAKLELARARRYAYPVTLGICRIDRIDRLADLYGLESRRLLMESLARVFSARCRSTDIIGRLGEDRVLWVLPHTDLEGARAAAERLREGVEALEVTTGSRQLRVTLSVGLACYVDRTTLFFDTVLLQAEQALVRAEERGGNWVELHPLSVVSSEDSTGAQPPAAPEPSSS